MLTSLSLKDAQFKKIEKKFTKTYLNSGLELVIHHKVTPEILYQTLHDEELEVLIWVSHAGGDHPAENGLAAKGVILDYFGNNVKNFFTTIPAKLKFLGVVGCSAESILNGFKARGNYDNRPNLEMMSFDKKVGLHTGLNKVLKSSLKALSKEAVVPNDSAPETMSVNIQREGKLSQSWLEMGDKVIAFLDTKTAQYTVEVQDTKNIKLVKDLSEGSSNLDKLSISSAGSTNWKLFSLPDGTAIGSQNQHLYIPR